MKKWTMTAALLAAFLLAGCANKQQTALEQDDFFEQWQRMAEESKGYSPPPKEHLVEITDIYTTMEEDEKKIEPEKPLPQVRVTLKFRDVDIRVVMRALATAAGKNIVMSGNVRGPVNANIENMPWDQAFLSIIGTHGLSYAWVGDILRVMTVEDMRKDIEIDSVQNERLAAFAQARKLEPLQTSVVRIRYAGAEGLRENLERFLARDDQGQPRGSVVVDQHNNALIIQAVADDTERMLKLLQNLDQPRAQVLLKAHIVETTKDTARDLGVQWGGRYRSGRISGSDRLYMSPGSGVPIPGPRPDRVPWEPLSPVGPILNFPAELGDRGGSLSLMYGMVDGNILELQLSALQSQGKLNILSSPSITTLDNQMAFTENGERVPYVARDSDGDPEVRFEDAVLRLEITPNIIDDEQLKLAVSVKKDEVDISRSVQGNPFIIKKHTETNLVVADQETIVISGLSRQRNALGQDGVPGLMNIPGLGQIFRRDTSGQLMEEVLIFITPHILPHRPVSSR